MRESAKLGEKMILEAFENFTNKHIIEINTDKVLFHSDCILIKKDSYVYELIFRIPHFCKRNKNNNKNNQAT